MDQPTMSSNNSVSLRTVSHTGMLERPVASAFSRSQATTVSVPQTKSEFSSHVDTAHGFSQENPQALLSSQGYNQFERRYESYASFPPRQGQNSWDLPHNHPPDFPPASAYPPIRPTRYHDYATRPCNELYPQRHRSPAISGYAGYTQLEAQYPYNGPHKPYGYNRNREYSPNRDARQYSSDSYDPRIHYNQPYEYDMASGYHDHYYRYGHRSGDGYYKRGGDIGAYAEKRSQRSHSPRSATAAMVNQTAINTNDHSEFYHHQYHNDFPAFDRSANYPHAFEYSRHLPTPVSNESELESSKITPSLGNIDESKEAVAQDITARVDQLKSLLEDQPRMPVVQATAASSSSVASSSARPAASSMQKRYFVMKLASASALEKTYGYKEWFVHPDLGDRLADAYNEPSTVFIIFYTEAEHCFAGYAIMTTDVDRYALSKNGDRVRHKFSVAWIKKSTVAARDVRSECPEIPDNPLATGMELSAATGSVVCGKLDTSNDIGHVKVVVENGSGGRFESKTIRRLR